MKRLILALLVALPLLAQDTTCNAGDYAVVVATNAADKGTAGGAEFNHTTNTWGIQAALDAQCSGLEIRVVCDPTNSYGSSSTSWTNRDVDKGLDSDIGTVQQYDPVTFAGYSNATTQLTPGNYCTLDFTGATAKGLFVNRPTVITGIHFKGISSEQMLEFSTSAAGSMALWNKFEDNSTGHAQLYLNANSVIVAQNYFYDSDTSGTLLRLVGNAIGAVVHQNVFNGGDKQIDISTGANHIRPGIIENIFVDGASNIFSATGSVGYVAKNTFYSPTTNMLDLGASLTSQVAIQNIFHSAGAYAFGDDGIGNCVVGAYQNLYYNNTTGNRVGTCTRHRNDFEGGALDTTATTFTNAGSGDFTIDTGGSFTYTFPLSTTSSTIYKGAVQEAGGGGATVIIQGVR